MRLNTIGNKLQFIFIPGLLIVAAVIFLKLNGTITRLYDDSFRARLGTELMTGEYVLEVFSHDVQMASSRTAEFRGVVDALSQKDFGGVGTALQERMGIEQLDYGFVFVKEGDDYKVVTRGHNLRLRPGEADDSYPQALWKGFLATGKSLDSEAALLFKEVEKDVLVREISELLSPEEREKLDTNYAVFASAPIQSFGEAIGFLVVGRNIKESPVLVSRLREVLGISEKDAREGFLLSFGARTYLRVGRASVLPEGFSLGAAPSEKVELRSESVEKGRVEIAYQSLKVAGDAPAVGVVSDKTDLLVALASVRASSSFIVVSITFLFITISLIAVWWLLRPVKCLVRAADKMAEGDYKTRVPVRSKDEIGHLSDSFNAMASSIEDSVKKIEQQNQELMRKNKDILLINDIVHEFAALTNIDGIRNTIGRRSMEITEAEHFGIIVPLSEGGYSVTHQSEGLCAEDRALLERGDFPAMGARIHRCSLANDEKDGDNVLSELVLFKDKGHFDSSELSLVSACVSAGLIAIENIQKLAMQAELETARAVQEALFPAAEVDNGHCRTVSHYFSPGQVGGDWYGYVQRSQDTLLFIADATGHGASAALITAVARSAVSSVYSIQDILETGGMVDLKRAFLPLDYMMHLNRMVAESGQGKVLMTGLCARVDPSVRMVEICNAAHTPPFLYDASTGQAKTLMCLGNRLGFCDDPELMVKTFAYKPGDILVLYSDGINEANNGAGEELGIKHLREVVAKNGAFGPQVLKDAILNALFSHAENVPLHDDVTLVIAELR